MFQRICLQWKKDFLTCLVEFLGGRPSEKSSGRYQTLHHAIRSDLSGIASESDL